MRWSIWEREGDDGEPLDLVEIVNFFNPYRPVQTPATDALKNAVKLDDQSVLRYVRLPDLIALKLYAGARQDHADVVELLARNADADLAEIRATAERHGFGRCWNR